MLTVLVLLRKEANSPSLTGRYARYMPDGRFTNRYDYHVVRLWQENADSFLNARIGLVPLAPLTDMPEADLPHLSGGWPNGSTPSPIRGPPSSGPQRIC